MQGVTNVGVRLISHQRMGCCQSPNLNLINQPTLPKLNQQAVNKAPPQEEQEESPPGDNMLDQKIDAQGGNNIEPLIFLSGKHPSSDTLLSGNTPYYSKIVTKEEIKGENSTGEQNKTIDGHHSKHQIGGSSAVYQNPTNKNIQKGKGNKRYQPDLFVIKHSMHLEEGARDPNRESRLSHTITDSPYRRSRVEVNGRGKGSPSKGLPPKLKELIKVYGANE